MQDKIIALTKANAELDAKLHSSQAEQNRALLDRSRMEQEKEILEKSNAWLTEELDRKTQSTNQERRKATENILDLQRRLGELESTNDRLKAEHGRLLDRFEQQQKATEEASLQLRSLRESSASKEESFEKELGMAHRMATLYRESAEERTKQCTELEGVVKELRTLMENTTVAHQEALEKADVARRAAEERAKEESDLRQRIVAASAALPASTLTPVSGGTPLSTTPGSTEMMGKYMELQERLRAERLKNRQREIVMEELLVEIERRAVLVKEQQEEYDSMRGSYEKLSRSLDEMAGEKRALEAALVDATGVARRAERESRSLELQVKDLGQQIARLLYDAQRGGSAGEGITASQFSGGNVSDVTTQLLIEFADISEMQQQNQRLLKVNRELSQAAEATREEAEEELRREYDSQLARVSTELEELRRNRENVEGILSQVVRQRDTLRQLLQGNDGDLAAARSLYARSLETGCNTVSGAPGTVANVSNGGAVLRADGTNYKDLFADLDNQFKQYKQEVAKNHEMLSKDVRIMRI